MTTALTTRGSCVGESALRVGQKGVCDDVLDGGADIHLDKRLYEQGTRVLRNLGLDPLRKSESALQDFFVEFFVRLPAERELPEQHRVEQYPECPDVHAIPSVFFSLDDFWRHVAWRSAEDAQLFSWHDQACEAEVDELNHQLARVQMPRARERKVLVVGDCLVRVLDEDVLEFDVPVHDEPLVAISDARAHLRKDHARIDLGQPAVGALLQEIVQGPTVHVLEHEENLSARIRHLVEFDDVWMAESVHDPDFPSYGLSSLRV
mmetsp:Transcript_11997/g.29043  ORF Transcript_11997/g.29043 Transcript_11997/m.29043 type:complete len:263 (-) Transcript_11997:2484-3272(-)